MGTSIVKPSNTSDRYKPGIHNLLLISAMGAGAIEAQEAQGQREAVASASLPTPTNETRAQYEALGFVFGEPFADDPIFCPVVMPAGWAKRATDHDMHNDIIDDAGNRRGSFFYKAAFYDRSAILYPPIVRYRVNKWYNPDPRRMRSADEYDDDKRMRYQVDDAETGKVLHRVHRQVTRIPPTRGGDHRAWWDEFRVRENEAFRACSAWLAARFPAHLDHVAYWSEAPVSRAPDRKRPKRVEKKLRQRNYRLRHAA